MRPWRNSKIFLLTVTTATLLVGGFFIFVGVAQASPGTEQIFFVEPAHDYTSRDQVVALNTHVGQKALFYVEKDWWNNLHPGEKAELREILNNLMKEFDNHIYPIMTGVFGTEWTPGIDNDPRLYVLFVRLKENAGGYFNAVDEYPKSRFPRSNEKEIIYLNSLYIKDKRIKAFVAHEFQHVITFYQKDKLRGISEEVWLNEARSEYASTLLGYDEKYEGSNLQKRVEDFLKKPSDSLTEWRNEKYDYGVINLFMQYLVDHYGQGVLTRMMQSQKVGIASIEEALLSFGFGQNFSDIFTNWTVANFLNDCSVPPVNTYCYLNPNLKDFRVSLNLVGSGSSFQTGFTVKDWVAYWYQANAVSGPLALKINFSSQAPTANFRIPYVILREDGSKAVAFVNIINKNLGQEGSAFVNNFGGTVASVVAVVSNQNKLSGFTDNDPGTMFVLDFSLASEPSPQGGPFPYADGSLLRAVGDPMVYVIKNGYKRWIQSAEIFNNYPHLRWEDIVEVSKEELDGYQHAWLVRYVDDPRVYEINADGTKHWLNMTAEQFSSTGRLWEMVYLVNKAEIDWYRAGADVMFR